MTIPLAFISYDFKHNEAERARFVEEIASCRVPFAVDDWSAERRSPREDWNKTVHSRIGRCDFLIVLVADGMDTGPVAEELLEARRCNVPFFGVYTGDAKPDEALPAGLPASRTIPWDWERIASAVEQVGGEGKHHVFR